MPYDYRLYPAEWRKKTWKAAILEAAGNRCEGCGAPQRSIRESAEGEPYMVYLSVAHRSRYETWKKDAETMVLCLACHRRYDRQFRRKPGTRGYTTPVGYAVVYLDGYLGCSRVLAGAARTLDDLRDLVAALPAETSIEVQVIALLAVVGNAHYRRESDGSLIVLGEYGPCVGLAVKLSS